MIALEYQLQRFRDLDLLQHFMIIIKESGSCIFYHPFKKTEISSDLISGFISAMSSMYGEFTGDGKRESVESLKYQGMNLDGFSGKYVLGVLISEGKLTTNFNLTEFINDFEAEYEDVLKDWKGFIKIFDHNWIVRHLLDSIDYHNSLPFLVSVQKPEKKQYRKIVDYLRIMKDRQDRFLIRKVLPGLQKFLNVSEAYVLDTLMMMKKEGVISYAPIEEVLELSDEGQILIETISSGAIVDEIPAVHETDDEANAQTHQNLVTITPEGKYSLDLEISLDILMRNSGDTWLRDIIFDIVELEVGKQVNIKDPHYIPFEVDSEKGTVWIRISFSDIDN